ncbi:serine/threonine-protein kinase [Streptomyces sp. enrichment culture]|uniref:serine/threonine-protein kinase n=1 Tax=Streptomyces sp. enrichment culture TaxID=1795815 RepID=UPI003F57CC5C
MALRGSDPVEVGGYLVEDRLGSGGMGVVYLARSASGRRLAVKVVHDQYADDEEFRTRFRRELAAARRVSGAFTAAVVDADADAPRPWMATLYIPGETLGSHVRAHGPLPLGRLRELAAGLAEALRDIHRAGVVHRDLKPANVMLAEDGPRVIDFGISRAADFAPADALTQTGRVMGTPPFMSPEQFSAPHDVGPAADVFSLGAVLTYAATGRGPFDSPSPYETAIRVVEGEPDLADVPAELLPFVRACLEKSPEARPTAHELLTMSGVERAPSAEAEPSDAPAGARTSAPGQWHAPPALSEWPDADTVRKADAARPAGAPGAAPAPKALTPARDRRRRRRLVLGWGAAAVALVAVAAGILSLRTGTASSSTGYGAQAGVSDLPEGWKPWRAAAVGPMRGAGMPFRNCETTGKNLVCAGDDLMAAGWNLSDGGRPWARHVNTTPGGGYGDQGAILGIHGGDVFAYGVDQPTDVTTGPPKRCTVQSLDAATGKVNWRTVIGEGDYSLAAAPENTAVVREGVITLYGDYAESYALLDADTGDVRWRQPTPDTDSQLLESVAGVPYLVLHDSEGREDTTRTTVVRLDPATGEARWTLDLEGGRQILGEAGGRLVLADDDPRRPVLTLIDPDTREISRPRLSPAPADGYTPYVVDGTLYLTWSSGTLRAFSPLTGRRLWENNSTVENPGPPAVSSTHVYVASTSGRISAMNRSTGEVEATRPGFDEATVSLTTPGARPLLIGDALYVPYGARSVYTVDVTTL